jgi:Fur family ferric uptake transcriptional regulator
MNIEQLAKTKDIKLTSAREELIQILLDEHKPLSYEDLKDNLNMDKATFYRNISIFEEKGLVDSFESNDKKRYYELKSNPHSHFICNICNKIECLSNSLDVHLTGYKIDNIIVKGICKDCNSKN